VCGVQGAEPFALEDGLRLDGLEAQCTVQVPQALQTLSDTVLRPEVLRESRNGIHGRWRRTGPVQPRGDGLVRELCRAADYGAVDGRTGVRPIRGDHEFDHHRQARFAQIQKRLADLSRIDVASVPKDRAGLGSEVTVENLESGEEIRYTLVIPELADGNKSFVSMASPVGKALMNRRVGDMVTITIPRGTLEYEVRRIVTLTGDVLE